MPGMRETYLSIFDRYWTQIDAGYTKLGGRLVGGWSFERGEEEFSTLNQNFIYALAMIAVAPETSDERRKRAEEMTVGVGDWLVSNQDRDGTHELITGGDSWGREVMVRLIYNWMETAYLIEPTLDPKRMTLWHQGVRSGVKRLATLIAQTEAVRKRPIATNLHAWAAVVVYRAGQLYEVSEWYDVAEPIMHAIAEDQQEGGYWIENSGPTTVYNHVTLHAMALCYRFTGDDIFRTVLERGTSFHMHMIYPDGSLVETADDRVHYNPNVCSIGHLAFISTPQGRRHVRLLTDRMLEEDTTTGFNYHNLSFLADSLRYSTDDAEADVPMEKEKLVWRLPGANAAVRKRDPWFAAYSGIVGKSDENERLFLDRTLHMSLWHRDVGLIVGNGNSKGQPEWGAFEWAEETGGGYLAIDGTVDLDTKGDRVVLTYPNSNEAQIRVTIKSETVVSITLTVTVAETKSKSKSQVKHHMPLRIIDGSEWKTEGGASGIFGEDPVSLDGKTLKGGLICDSWSLSGFGDDASFEWPVNPHNPYTIDGSVPQVSAVGMLTVPVTKRQRLSLTIG